MAQLFSLGVLAMTATCAWLFWMLGASSIACAMWTFDLLVRWQYEHVREQWERDGKPHGIFWSAAECVGCRSEVAKQRIFFLWNFKRPDWIAQSPECKRWLLRFRVAGITSLVGILGALYIVTR